MLYVSIALILLLVKAWMAGVLGLVACRILRYDFWVGMLCGWIILQALQLSGMVVLSISDSLTPSYYRLWMGIQIGVVVLLARRMPAPNVARFRGIWGNHDNWAIFFLTAVATGLLLVRALWFFDNVHDSQNHYLTRLAYFFQHQSIFSHGPSLARMFCYEWNAQLNAFHYQLLAGTDRALTLASVEAWWVSLLAMVAFCRSIGLSIAQSFWVALLIDTTPLVFNLVGVTKGDVLAMAVLVGGLASLLRQRAGGSQNSILAAVLFLAYGAGCKSTMLPVLAIFAVVVVFWLLVERPISVDEFSFGWSPLRLASLLMIPLFLARYLANLVVYGNPFQRGPGEVVRFSWHNFGIGLQTQFQYVLGLRPPIILSLSSPYHSALTGGFAFTGWLLFFAGAVWVGGLLARKHPVSPFPHSYGTGNATLVQWYSLVLIAAWLFQSGLFPVNEYPDFRTWLLRFFLPFLVPPSLVALGYLAQRRWMGMGWAFPLLAFSVAILNLHIGFCPSDIMSVRGLTRIPYVVSHYDHFASKLGDECGSKLRRDLGDLPFYRGQSQRILVYHYPDTVMYPFFGEDLEWKVDLIDSTSALATLVEENCYDWIVLTRYNHNEKGLDEAKEILGNTKYRLNSDGQWWKLYKRLQ